MKFYSAGGPTRREKLQYWLWDRKWLKWFFDLKYLHRPQPCFRCWRITRFHRCDNCGHWYCIIHCDWDNDSTWEYPGFDYPLCPHCMVD